MVLEWLVVLSLSELPCVLLLSAPLCQYDIHDTFSCDAKNVSNSLWSSPTPTGCTSLGSHSRLPRFTRFYPNYPLSHNSSTDFRDRAEQEAELLAETTVPSSCWCTDRCETLSNGAWHCFTPTDLISEQCATPCRHGVRF